MKKIILLQILLLIILFSILSCSSTPTVIEENLTPLEFFQKAQEASDETNYKLAMHYYRTFQERFPNEVERNLWASYEIAFIYYKTKENEKALELFNDLLKKYESDEAETYPEGPRILAEKVIARIEENRGK